MSEWQEERLKGCIEVPKKLWSQISHGSQIRYIQKDKGFKGGATVTANNGDKLKLSIGGKNTWSITYEEIENIYVKTDAVTQLIMEDFTRAINELNDNLQILSKQIEVMKK
jgi:tRNA(Phe) wybutosine-synthesizing methylase Tyw3